MPGGVPLFYKGDRVGGRGVSAIAQNDEPVAQAAGDAMESIAQ